MGQTCSSSLEYAMGQATVLPRPASLQNGPPSVNYYCSSSHTRLIMAICKLLFTLSVFLSASNGEVFGLAPVPGAVSIPFSRGPHPHAKRSGTTDVYFASRYLDYIVNLTIGTPPQKIFLSLDTGSSDTLLVREETPLCIQNAGICPDLAYCK